MTTADLVNAVKFLERVFVGQSDEQLLVETIENLKKEIRRRKKNEQRATR
jgi:hypothetical protein